ncbi:MAG: phosphocholine cytidylyltransferase family protein [Methanobrevibacter ruminantium]|jgi:Predicted sugar nucleotidyltransferases|uniref:phosphocholine cytidylyltransferase family protein n=1 Tax=Methanobrevibacter ruminantium TaxID=83816 RepID=UPI0026EC83B3|nr:phosphocholine cytidylyltransferase family protein [Methanobrevibacter ruminantium]MDD6048783.1 phosphocholine cytidylyltransferase family protein [Methanobrevibacter ruminantium]MDO5841913.1 phosphocholine cytidylyltransferase family protein [Methanobrevibacter ruminantium]
MIGVILAAGMGTRLMPLTKDIPKALLKINGMTLVERMIKNCIDAGISKFIVVVGYNKDKVIDLCPELEEKYDIEIKTVINEKFDVTNTSVSTYLASKYIEEYDLDDFILVNGDNVVDPEIIKILAKSINTGMIIDNFKELNEESFKLIIDDESFNEGKTIANGKINSIGKGLDIPSSTGEFIGVSKVKADDVAEFNRILEGLIEDNPQNYYDFAYKDLSLIKTIDFVLTNGLKWTEIDDHTDWKNAQLLVKELEG